MNFRFLLVSYLIFFNIFWFSLETNAGTLDKIKKVLKNNDIKNSEKTSKTYQDTLKPNQIYKKNSYLTNAKSDLDSSSVNDSILISQPIKININGKTRTVNAQFLNPKFKKKYSDVVKKTKKTSTNVFPMRINETSEEKSYDVPCAYTIFNFPLAPDDKIRCEGEKKLLELYNQVVEALSKNDYSDESFLKLYTTNCEILENYGKYPDICALSTLYINDVYFKFCQGLGDSYIKCSTTPFYFMYEQLKMQYESVKNVNQAMKTIFTIIENRQKDLKSDEERLMKENEENFKNVKIFENEMKKNIESSNMGIPEENDKEEFAKSIASYVDVICNNYKKCYINYMLMNNKAEADAILKIEKKGDEYVISGKLYEAYKSVPYYLNYKYHYSVNDDETHEIKVKMFRNADNFIDILNGIKTAQLRDKIDKIDDNGMSDNEKRVLSICNFISDYKLSSGSENDQIAEERGSNEKIVQYKENAYGLDEYNKKNDYLKRKPNIGEIYFSKFDSMLGTNIGSAPDEYVTLRAKVDSNMPITPGYGFLCKVYTVKISYLPEEKEPKIDINQYKYVKMMPDNLYGGFYCKFKINEEQNQSNSDTPPVIAASPAPGRIFENETSISAPVKNLINTQKDAQKDSIACFNAESFNEQLFKLYNNDYFSVQNGNYKTNNRMGFSIDYSYKDSAGVTNEEKLKGFQKHEMQLAQISKDFLKFGGGEYVYCEYFNGDGSVKRGVIFIRNQADWFIIDAHGIVSIMHDSDGGISTLASNIQMSVSELIKPDGTSEYAEDMEVLTLFTCCSLNYEIIRQLTNTSYAFSKGWQKVLPKGLILGYKHEIYPSLVVMATKLLHEKLNSANKKLSFEEIAQIWLNVNAEIYQEFLNTGKKGYESARGAAYILNNKLYGINSNTEELKKLLQKENTIINKIYSEVNPDEYHYEFSKKIYTQPIILN
ncbi:MAG: hypothetical protein QMC67_16005 [Candidatus Wallbacteria bacterium]